MNGKVGGRPASTPADVNINSNKSNMVSDASPEVQEQPRNSRAPRKAATFGKRSNSMRRNPKAVVAKQGWLYKQASSGVKQWNKRWFVLTDRCLFYYKDDKEETVLGSLPLLSFQVEVVQPSDNVTRKFAFKVWYARAEEEEEGKGEDGDFKVPLVFCVQVEHTGTRTYYFSAESHQEQEEWIQAMSDAAQVTIQPTQRTSSESGVPGSDANHSMVTKPPDSHTEPTSQTHSQADSDPSPQPEVNGVGAIEDSSPYTLPSDGEVRVSEMRREGEGDGGMEDDRGGNSSRGFSAPSPLPGRTQPHPNHHPNGLTNNVLPNGRVLPAKGPLPLRAHGNDHPPRGHPPRGHPEGVGRMLREARELQQQENVVLRRGFVPRTAPERLAQRKSSMTQLQQWVNQRRGTAIPDDLNSPTRYYTVNRGISSDCYGVYLEGPQYVEEYPLYPPGVRPDSICSVSAMGGYDRRWTVEEKRRSLRDGPPLYGAPPMPKEPWAPQFYGGAPMDAVGASMRRLSIQPRSRSVPRSPSSASSRGPYSPGPHSFVSPARSPSTRFDRLPVRMREDVIYADPSVYGLRRSLSSPKYDYPGDRRSLSQGLYYYNYPPSPSIHGKMVPPFHDIYGRDLHPTLKLNEIETSKLLGRLCEQNRMLKDQEAVVHRLRIDKDSLEEALVATHQEMELYHKQPLASDKLQYKKETLQNQLINIRGELSQASSNLTTLRMEFEALEDEANAIHGDLWEQLNAGGQSELVHRHIQKEFWRVQDVLEGLHKSNSSRGTDTAKHRVASGASGSFSTNSPASPLSSVSLTSPLSPFSPVPGSQASPTKQLGPEPKYGEWTGNTDLQDQDQERQSNMNKVGIVPPRTKSPMDDFESSHNGVHRRSSKAPNGMPRERPKSAVFPAEVRSKMSVEEQNERIRRNQSSSVRDKRRSLNLSAGQSAAGYRVVRRRLTADEVDIKDLESAVRGAGLESPREEIARLRRLQIEPDHYDLDISKELMAPDKVVIPERYLDLEDDTPLSPEEQKEKQKKVERIRTLIAKSNLQNVVPLLDGPIEGSSQANSEQQLQEQEKRIEISCTLATEASRRSRLLSAQCAPSPPTSPTSLASPLPSDDLPSSTHVVKV